MKNISELKQFLALKLEEKVPNLDTSRQFILNEYYFENFKLLFSLIKLKDIYTTFNMKRNEFLTLYNDKNVGRLQNKTLSIPHAKGKKVLTIDNFVEKYVFVYPPNETIPKSLKNKNPDLTKFFENLCTIGENTNRQLEQYNKSPIDSMDFNYFYTSSELIREIKNYLKKQEIKRSTLLDDTGLKNYLNLYKTQEKKALKFSIYENTLTLDSDPKIEIVLLPLPSVASETKSTPAKKPKKQSPAEADKKLVSLIKKHKKDLKKENEI